MNFRTQPLYMKIMLFGVMMLFGFLLSGIAMLIIDPSSATGSEYIIRLKLAQGFSQLGMFIVPTLLFSWLVSSGPKKYFDMHSKFNLQHIGLTILFLVVMVPLIGFTNALNQEMQLPAFLEGMEEWMKSMEERMADVTEKIAFADNIPTLLFNLVVMAVIPAIGEELLFRGFIQKHLQAWFKNKHVSIWVVAILFSAFHLQFYGFLPRMLMGAALGYVYVWTRNLWMPILFHFLNNALAVFSYYMLSIGKIDGSPEDLGTIDNPYVLLGMFVMLFLVVRWFHINRVKDEDWPNQLAEL